MRRSFTWPSGRSGGRGWSGQTDNFVGNRDLPEFARQASKGVGGRPLLCPADGWPSCVSGMSGSIARPSPSANARVRAGNVASPIAAKAVTGLARPSVEPSRNVRERASPARGASPPPASIRHGRQRACALRRSALSHKGQNPRTALASAGDRPSGLSPSTMRRPALRGLMRPYAARDRASGSVASPNAARPTPVSSFAAPVLAHGACRPRCVADRPSAASGRSEQPASPPPVSRTGSKTRSR